MRESGRHHVQGPHPTYPTSIRPGVGAADHYVSLALTERQSAAWARSAQPWLA